MEDVISLSEVVKCIADLTCHDSRISLNLLFETVDGTAVLKRDFIESVELHFE